MPSKSFFGLPFRLAATVALSCLLCACQGTVPTDYGGNDAGHVVMGIGAVADSPYTRYAFTFRRSGDNATFRLVYFITPQLRLSTPIRYQTPDEAGVIEAASIPRGKYEMVNFEAAINLGLATQNFSARQDFSIPFEVRANEVVYLGNYQGNPIRARTESGRVVARGPFFVVEDRSAADLRLAKDRIPSLPTERVINATPDADQLRIPFFVSVGEAKLARQRANSALQPVPRDLSRDDVYKQQ